MKLLQLTLLVALVVAEPALAEPPAGDSTPAWATCVNGGNSMEATIAACTSIINRGDQSDENRAVVFRSRAKAYASTDQYDAAIEDYSRAIALKPNYAEAITGRGAAYESKHDSTRALADFNHAIAISPTLAGPYVGRCWVYYDLHDYSLGLRDCNRAIELAPDNHFAFNNRGLIYEAEGSHDLAIRDFDHGIGLAPTEAALWVNRGITYAAIGQNRRAIDDFDHAIALQPTLAAAYCDRGISYFELGDADRAIADFTTAISRKSDYAQAFGNRGFVWLKKGGPHGLEQAISDSEQALRFDPSSSFAKNNLDQARRARDALLAQAGAAGTGARIALVIGNSSYASAPALPNARNDAEDVAIELKKLGYRIFGYPKTDLGKNDMTLEIEAFKKESVGAAAAIVWYSGHGQQMREEGADNADDWIIPVDAKINRRADVASNAIRLGTLKIAVLAAKQLRMVVIDACRNSPFYTGDRATRGMGRNELMPGVLLIQSTQPGEIAQDGDGRNSPFAQAFLAAVRATPKQDVRLLFSVVSGTVMQMTHATQKPQIDDGVGTAETLALMQ